jgi:regulatory protein
MVITNIERQKRHHQRVNIFVDGKFTLGLHENVLIKFGLRKGDTLDEQTLERIEREEEFHRAKEKALRLLGRRARSEKELRDKLREREFHPDAITTAIESMKAAGLLNDLSFAQAYAHDLLLRKPSGAKLLRQKLRSKGIDPDTIQKVLDLVAETNDENEIALTAAQQILKRYRKSKKRLDSGKKKQLIAANLARRGFDWSTINSTLKIIFPKESAHGITS